MNYLEQYDVVDGIREGGTFLLNSIYDADETVARIPNKVKRILAQRKAKFYIINATKLAHDIGLGNRSNTIMQAAFFKLAEIIDFEDAVKFMKKEAYKSYIKKGEAIVELNYKAIDTGAAGIVPVPVDAAWANLADTAGADAKYPGTPFVEKIVKPINAARGYSLPVSAFVGGEDGTFEAGTTAYEKRGIGVLVPQWVKENCIQCNQCVFVCPHAVIRPFLMTDAEVAAAPASIKGNVLEAKGKELKGLSYKIQVSPLDCTGCDLCVVACPTKEKSLVMAPLHVSLEAGDQDDADYLFKNVTYKDDIIGKGNVKGSSFCKPLFEFHAACPGCGETPYLGLVTRLFGESMMIANATGCSSIYGASAPATPYCKNDKGHGPAFANSLFEDNAQFGYGMHMASETMRDRIHSVMEASVATAPAQIAALYTEWMANRSNRIKTGQIRDALVPLLEANPTAPGAEVILSLKLHIAKKSQWIVGGDGWAYDIGYGGLDHVIASGQDVNLLVLDTEVYSNTGGQSSKASRAGSVAFFAAGGKPIQKKDLGYIAMTNGNVFVAQINSNASAAQAIKAIEAAESYDGPSVIIAYSPCIAHGIKGGMGKSQVQAELATKCGYWPIYTYDPRLAEEGKNPITITGKEPDWSLYDDFLMNEVRYVTLKKSNPDHAQELYNNNKKDAQRRWRQLTRLAVADFSNEVE
jgi:pyruvate-ferredoxin/flavodoxin oxidoreductase